MTLAKEWPLATETGRVRCCPGGRWVFVGVEDETSESAGGLSPAHARELAVALTEAADIAELRQRVLESIA